ncbi:hypothetical protein QQS21_001357 [Conoideocrella luteorostrata]|uniref:Uncharacterized protein n=1 Tax=Conoideocrella luteorostrata TaxID=1105319 RepID=A0AAJ0G3G0_9HYPO|nr:hypothetical protein QQS21_001357 [Conoideocrella luteorostrata]
MSSTQWKPLVFRVETTTPDARTDVLYANSRMQVPVIISIKAWDKSTQSVYKLSDSELNEIELIDYDAPTTKLADGWSYSANRNDVFANTATARLKSFNLLPSPLEASVDKSDTKATSDDIPQKKKYMVSTARVENKRIGARIKLPDGTMVTTTTSPFNFYVTLVGNPPVVYTTDNIRVARVTVDKGDRVVGVYNSSGTMISSSKMPWSQDNYYISSSVHDFVKADIYNYDTTGHEKGHHGDSRLANLFNYWSDSGKLRLSFIWGFATQSTKNAGLYRETGSPDTTKVEAFKDIKVNQKSSALCLTRMAFNYNRDIWGSNWSNGDCGFTVYDRYGNTGKFYASWSKDEDIITIRDSNL